MTKTLKEKMEGLTPERRQRIQSMAAEMMAEEATLKDLRTAMALTQERLAETLNIRQENVSRIEKRNDLMLSTLQSYVQAMGGKLRLVAEFPGRNPVILKGLQSVIPESMNTDKRKRS
jgi:transcriptional regulator with XRE-family HTH domain